MKKLTKALTLLYLFQAFSVSASAEYVLSEAELKKNFGIPFSESKLLGNLEIRDREKLCETLGVPSEHISVDIPRRSSSLFDQFVNFRTTLLPFREGASYEFYLYFSKAGQPFDLKEFTFSLNQGIDDGFWRGGLAFHDLLFFETRNESRSWRPLPEPSTLKEKTLSLLFNQSKEVSYKISSNPFMLSLKLDQKSRFRVCLGEPPKLFPDHLEILVHPRIKDSLTYDLRQENQSLLRQHQALATEHDQTRAQLADLMTQVKTLTLRAAAERSFDSVTNTTVSSLRSTQNNTPTNDPGDDT